MKHAKTPQNALALVAARLVCQEEKYTLKSGREVLLVDRAGNGVIERVADVAGYGRAYLVGAVIQAYLRRSEDDELSREP